MKLLVSEILAKVATAETEAKKINLLRENYSPALEDVLHWAYDPNIKFFTNKVPPYTPDQSPDGLAMTTFYSEHKRLYLFLEQTKIDAARKNILLIQMLEALSGAESKILENILLKNIPEVSKDIAEKAYPGLLQRPIRIPVEA
jgi:hypothetical protein